MYVLTSWAYVPCIQYHNIQSLKLWRRNNAQIKQLKFTYVIEKDREEGLNRVQNLYGSYLHTALTAMVTVHTGKSTK
jgi:hypothetical protein